MRELTTNFAARKFRLLLVLLVLPLAGCSAIDWVYNRARPMPMNSKAFDLDDAQIEAVEKRLQNFFAWHRSEELPRYHALLDRAAEATADGLNVDEFPLSLKSALRSGAYWRSVERMADDVGDLASTLRSATNRPLRGVFPRALRGTRRNISKIGATA